MPTGSWILFIVGVATVLWFIGDIIFIIRFRKYMEKIGYPTTQNRWHTSIRAMMYAYSNAAMIEFTFFGQRRNRQWIVVIIAIIIIVLGVARAAMTGHTLEFSRAGALVVIAGLFSLVLEYSIKKSYDATLDLVKQPLTDDKLATALGVFFRTENTKGEELAVGVNVFVSFVGTLIWAYGDQLLQCNIFQFEHLQLFSIITENKDNVTCLPD